MKPRFYLLNAEDRDDGAHAQGPLSFSEAHIRQVADPTLKIVTADQLAVIRRTAAKRKPKAMKAAAAA